MARIRRLGEVYSAGDVTVTLDNNYNIDPSAISYGYEYAHEYQRGLRREPRGWRMGQKDQEGSITLPLDMSTELENKYGDLAFIRPFSINVAFANAENEMIYDRVWAKFKGNKRNVTGDGELENEYELFIISIDLNI